MSELGWREANQEVLAAAVARVRTALERHVARAESGERGAGPEGGDGPEIPEGSALGALVSTFDLSPFERDVLMLCAGLELDATFAPLCARAQGDPQRAFPTFGLALAALPGAGWEALSPLSALRHWRLLEVGAGPSLTSSPLRIDERILHFLVGVEARDERLSGFVEPVSDVTDLVRSHREIAERVAATWARTAGTPEFPVVQLCGEEARGKRSIAAAACRMLELDLHVLRAEALPTGAGELADLARLWEREAMLGRSALLLDCDEVEPTDAAREGAILWWIESARGAVFLSTRQRRRPRQAALLTFDVEKPTSAEQKAVWRSALGPAARSLNGQVDLLVSQFNLSAPTIHAAYAGALGQLTDGEEAVPAPEVFGAALWDTCRLQARPRLEDLAQRITPAAGWTDLILPASQVKVLKEVAEQVRHRVRVYESWGFAAKSSRGLGITALFAGTSGTGKTMAAEVLAGELRLDLYRIDLSAVVSKYIGETEKNLRRVFDAAEEGGAILLFDEADALFGKRSEVKDSHDRHANIEVSYLLQRMEAYRGLAILTTNLKDSLDGAFLRRLRFIVEFPFPDLAQRAEIWRRVFPGEMPTDGLDVEKLARVNLAGGSIRNVAVNAAFFAAAEGEPVRMKHLLAAVRGEYAKNGKPLPESEVRGW
ncbi:MAG TPA: ATP-binding protein [Thermoanaerobaculia bacterium]|nr:ATP-binding protein [Thermoanaerobaculia bacterium]